MTPVMPKRKTSAEKGLAALERSVRKLEGRVAKHEVQMRAVSGSLATRAQRESLMMDALGLSPQSKKGDRGSLSEITESLLHLEEYLLRNAERIDNILVTLKNHRELLAKMNTVYFKAGERGRIKMELDIMRNTISVLTLAGTDLDISLVKDIKSIQAAMASGKVDTSELRKSKQALDKKFDGELKRFDLEALYLKRKNIPGYV